MALHRNEAYDMGLFETAEPVKREREKKNNVLNVPKETFLSKSNAKQKVITTAKIVSFALIIVSVVGVIIQGQVQLTELNQQIADATASLSEKESEFTQIQMKVESKLSSPVVEEYALGTLGMSRADGYQKNYISLSEGDKAEVMQEENNNIFDSIADAIGGLWS